jgi:hypothetical protein
MHYTKAFFSYVFQQRGPIAMGKKSNGGPVKSERVPMSPTEADDRLRRIQRAIRHGVEYADLVERFGEKDLAKARRMMPERK